MSARVYMCVCVRVRVCARVCECVCASALRSAYILKAKAHL